MAKKTKVNRIKDEYERLLNVYYTIPTNKLETVKALIQNAAFMKVTLEDLQESINTSGCSDEYKNGENQYGTKASAELQAYNSLIKNYNSVCNGLIKLVPDKVEQKSRLEMMMADD